MFNLFRRFWNNNSGATAIEYGLIGVLISISIISGANLIGDSVKDMLQAPADKISDLNKKNDFE